MKDAIEIKRLNCDDTTDFQKLISLFQNVFETESNTQVSTVYLQKLLQNTYFIVYVVKIRDEVIGGLTAYELRKYYAEESEIFIYDIAVSPDFQRKGLGKQLLTQLEVYGHELGIRTIFVAAHEDDKHAVEFYRATGGKAEKVIHFDYVSKQNFPSKE